ncbi:MAG: hypothetical protein HOK52_07870 [Candidatus Marinimicrobia bacterium]|jgi:tetratricopeptide (TPR) repeat protein|nr:hypothetical protein [Candidatus Neomarinimicrobiota bacterium]MBT3936846.1 hypothetical protein [Candidatus Neomarinimicrobiota bacterium]MBT3961959.1 hypothetical protein [Candidatus Neomarinimicrobiota bacterium]MBT4383649.1 hypothetical protein [Candidatus Neomarinimicrobiota bacterium]MBT4635812.1 hypothetical protein [Candidatus Neomarinimicrobiota bacterium]
MNIQSLLELELYFADHMDTILFPVLAEKYYSKGDYYRARKVCEIGLGYHEYDQEGHYLLGLVEKEAGNLKAAEKAFIMSLNYPSDHLNATLELCSVQTELERSPKTLFTHWKKVLELDPANEAAQVFVQRMDMQLKKEVSAQQKETKKRIVASKKKLADPPVSKKQKEPLSAETKPTNPITIPDYKEDTEPLKISNRLATFTMVTVLKNQGLLNQALEVLNVLEQKGESLDRIKRERKEINDFISNN